MYVTSPICSFDNIRPAVRVLEPAGTSRYARFMAIAAGRPLFCEGDDAPCLYEIVEGVVRTSKLFLDGRRQVLSFGYPGDIVGLSHDGIYHNDCDAVSNVTVRIVHRHTGNSSSREDRDFQDRLLTHATAEMAGMQEHFLMLGRKSAMEKVASFLSVLVDRVGEKHDCKTCFALPMSRADIADFLGLTIETVSRTLTTLRQKGVLELPEPRLVCICKPDQLRQLAERDI